MAITSKELTSSPDIDTGDTLKETYEYEYYGDTDPANIRAAVEADTDETITSADGYNTLVRNSISLDAEYVDPAQPDKARWNVTVAYGTTESGSNTNQGGSTGEEEYSFDTTGGSFNIKQSRGTRAAHGETWRDYGGAIGITHNSDASMDVEGVDVHIPNYSWTSTKYYDDDAVTFAYRRLVAWLTGSVNNVAFGGFEPGEVLFTGCRGSIRGQEDWQIDFSFEVRTNRSDFNVSDISIPFKYGWDYMWVEYWDEMSDYERIMRPQNVYIEQVYPFRDLRKLGVLETT